MSTYFKTTIPSIRMNQVFMARVRTFIAVDLGPNIRERLLDLQETLAREIPDVKWVEAENMHLTLLFLGEVDERDLLPVCRCVSKGAENYAPFSLELRGLGCFPNPRRPRVIWAGIQEGAAELVAIHDDLETPLLEQGCYRREERKFTPHVTMGRTTNDLAAEPLARLMPKYQNWSGGFAAVKEVLVMSSELTSKSSMKREATVILLRSRRSTSATRSMTRLSVGWLINQ